MPRLAFSIPQLICFDIFNQLFGIEGAYNTRRVVKPYELDVFYKEYSFAVEYHGKGWHEQKDAIDRDKKKAALCAQKGISLLVIIENNRQYESDIKNQIISNLDMVNRVTGKQLVADDVLNCVVEYANLFTKGGIIIDDKELECKIAACKNATQFIKRHQTIYRYLCITGKSHLLDKIRSCKRITNDELKQRCLEITDYSEFVKTNLYQVCFKRDLLRTFSIHMYRKNRGAYTEQEVVELSKNYSSRNEFQLAHCGAYRRALKTGLLDTLFPPRVYGIKVTKEEIIRRAKHCKKRSHFKAKQPYAYRLARQTGLLSVLFPKNAA
jgi:hypothetical protein